ncbi:MAG: hypothetical protein ACRELX_17000, partial [Longimicrobiales bacterium]
MRAMYYGDTKQLEIPVPWEWPAGVTTRRVDRETGKLASPWCPDENVYTEFYIPGTEPTEACEPQRGLFGAPIRGVRDDSTKDPFGGRFRAPLPPRRDTIPPDTMRDRSVRRFPPDTTGG